LGSLRYLPAIGPAKLDTCLVESAKLLQVEDGPKSTLT
jgi:hypothetical protein